MKLIQKIYQLNDCLTENKVGGELDFDENIHLGGNEFYGQVVDYNQFEINTKNSYQLNDKNVILAQAFFICLFKIKMLIII